VEKSHGGFFHGQQESTGQVPVSCQAIFMPDESRTPKKPAKPKGGAKKAKPRGDRIGLARREHAGGETVWELVHPRCSRQRKEDLDEVEAMLDAGEAEIARDELIWLLSECPDFLDAHVQLGLIALEDGDPKLARGHFGRAYELVLRAIDAAGVKGPLPYALEANRVFFEAAKGLAHTLMITGRSPMARDLLRRTLQLDTSDTLGIRGVVEGRPTDSCGG
jgi:hypothetical protein